jgi:uncharacterized protein (DUF1810 family)
MTRVDRFRAAQDRPGTGFAAALREIRSGGKRGHWIWYVFPQLAGLGQSSMAREFAIGGEEEAVEFLRDEELRTRLLTMTAAVAQQLRAGVTLRALMASEIDARKVVSSLTLFGAVARTLRAADENAFAALAQAAEDVLATASAQGYPSCAYTLTRLSDR